MTNGSVIVIEPIHFDLGANLRPKMSSEISLAGRNNFVASNREERDGRQKEEEMVSESDLYFNGINALTGEYAVPPMDFRDAAAMIKAEPEERETESWLRRIWRTISQPHLGLPLGVNPEVVEEAGWGVVFHQDEDPAVKEALVPLVDHRLSQIKDQAKVKLLDYHTGEDRAGWLARHGVAAGTVDPTKVPYYLLLVGSPERIPFEFCHLLDVEYAVGWVHFDTVAEYKQYADSVIAYETSDIIASSKEVVFFGTRHSIDPATQMSADFLVKPLADGTSGEISGTPAPGVAQRWGFRMRKLWGDGATKEALSNVFAPGAGGKPPAVLFTATHGMVMPLEHAKQRAVQGALLCQNWPAFGTMTPEHYFTAADLPMHGYSHGLITFHFACFSAGTPKYGRFVNTPGQPPPQIANQPFLASLPKALLAHPEGGALACIGHVDRAKGSSIVPPKAGPQLLPFENAIGGLLTGKPVGYAIKDFNERFAVLSAELSTFLRNSAGLGPIISDKELSLKWIERNDVEGYVVMGDPAVKLRVNDLV